MSLPAMRFGSLVDALLAPQWGAGLVNHRQRVAVDREADEHNLAPIV